MGKGDCGVSLAGKGRKSGGMKVQLSHGLSSQFLLYSRVFGGPVALGAVLSFPRKSFQNSGHSLKMWSFVAANQSGISSLINWVAISRNDLALIGKNKTDFSKSL